MALSEPEQFPNWAEMRAAVEESWDGTVPCVLDTAEAKPY